jgi:hypothetical protein
MKVIPETGGNIVLVFTLSVPNEGYSRNVLYELNLISTCLLLEQKSKTCFILLYIKISEVLCSFNNILCTNSM